MTDETTTGDGGGTALTSRNADLTYEIDANEAPSEAVVRAVASLTNTPILGLDPLYDVLDPEHLDGLCGGDENGALRGRSVAFEFNGCQVAVTPDVVHVRDRAGDAD